MLAVRLWSPPASRISISTVLVNRGRTLAWSSGARIIEECSRCLACFSVRRPALVWKSEVQVPVSQFHYTARETLTQVTYTVWQEWRGYGYTFHKAKRLYFECRVSEKKSHRNVKCKQSSTSWVLERVPAVDRHPTFLSSTKGSGRESFSYGGKPYVPERVPLVETLLKFLRKCLSSKHTSSSPVCERVPEMETHRVPALVICLRKTKTFLQ